MGSDLFLSIDVHHPEWRDGVYGPLFRGPSTDLDRGIVVDAFDERDARDAAHGYLTPSEWVAMAGMDASCPWVDDEPYWVRRLDGQEFLAIVLEKRWQRMQRNPEGGYDFVDTECSAELRAFAAAVESLLDDGCKVRV